MSRIGRLAATVAVPDHGDLPLGTLDRVATAVNDGVPAALSRRFPAASEAASGRVPPDRPVVVIRRLQVSAAVPASASPDEISERLADRLARAIVTAPADGQVRYPSRAAHIGAFVAALSGGTGDAWVFESFLGARLLAPLAAMRALADRYGVPVVAVLSEMYRAGQLTDVLILAAQGDLARTWAMCLATPHRRLTVLEALGDLGSDPADDSEPSTLPSPEATALLLAARAAASGRPVSSAVAVAAALAASGEELRNSAVVRGAGADLALAQPATAEHTPSGSEPVVLEAAGAPAFLLLPSFERVGLGRLPAAQRANVLAAATRTAPEDPAIARAAGVDDEPEGSTEPAVLTAVVQQALIDDDRLGLERLQTYRAQGRVIVADPASGVWLAILEPVEDVQSALIPALARLPCEDAKPDEALAARIAVDLGFLLPDDVDRAHRDVAVAARAGLGHFARRLAGFGASSLPYLSDRFLTRGGTITDLGDALWVRLPSPPLLVVLALAGLDRTTIEVPWLEPTVTITHEGDR